jgi:hypothetical protein
MNPTIAWGIFALFIGAVVYHAFHRKGPRP